MTHCAVSGSLCFSSIIRLAVALHTPAHIVTAPSRVTTVEDLQLLYLAVTLLALKASIQVTHVREMHMVRNLVDTNPRNRVSALNELLNFCHFFRIVTTGNSLVAAPARRNRWYTCIDGSLCRIVTILAVHVVLARLITSVLIMGKCDRLARRVFRRRRVFRLNHVFRSRRLLRIFLDECEC